MALPRAISLCLRVLLCFASASAAQFLSKATEQTGLNALCGKVTTRPDEAAAVGVGGLQQLTRSTYIVCPCSPPVFIECGSLEVVRSACRPGLSRQCAMEMERIERRKSR